MGWFLKLPWKNIILSDFRPRLGMGWFNAVMAVWGDNPTFSSPSGDGVVRIIPCSGIFHLLIFVPAWGWGGSKKRKLKEISYTEFSSPIGDGLVRYLLLYIILKVHNFRPRLGMGWFLCNRKAETKGRIFVPAWGWVGSEFYELDYNDPEGFRPRLGMGWFAVLYFISKRRYSFRPRVGLGWFLCNRKAETKGRIFVPAWGWVGSS